MNKKGEPAAWLVDGGGYQYVSLFRESADATASEEGGTVAPLYRSPTLTDAEREAVEAAQAAFAQAADPPLVHPNRGRAVTLRGLLERLGGER